MQSITVAQLDFLPASYRQQTARRRDRRWRAVLFVVGVLVLCAAWFYRVVDRRTAQRDLDALSEQHRTALARQRDCEATKQVLLRAKEQAELITYLRHPWTTSQILAAVVNSMPESLRLTELRLVREPLGGRAGQASPRRSLTDTPDVAESRLPPAQNDLARLRAEYDQQQVVILITGETLDGDALHRYIRQLAKADVIASAELISLQRDASPNLGRASRSQFQARAVVRPGIGQPGGMDGASTSHLAKIAGESLVTAKSVRPGGMSP